ncbi:MAG: hypothetical protein HQL51_08975, partial [Magnetococcales bacterium]|nr:hypothetical protein [Magnetococcales bacterium]
PMIPPPPLPPPPLRAAALLKQFAVLGRYYRMELGGRTHGCRSTLELIDRTVAPPEPDGVADHPPDLLVVMMNPGSSRPLAGEEGVALRAPGEIPTRGGLTPARPDTTQYQIMKVMVAKGFRHARVFNLSDLREPKSPRFLALVEELSRVPGGRVHSLFCPERREERRILMGEVPVPVIVGWGRHPALIPLARQCLEGLTGRTLVGTPVSGSAELFAHPSPMLQRMKDQWIDAILARMEAVGAP